ncbi:DUF1534 domain-containing protein [Pseudomonas sp. SXM-1]|nr:DUF1534 domain-containing protein [Pseudomonas sp. SXM-1]
MRGNASRDAPRLNLKIGRGASRAAFPRRAWERSSELTVAVAKAQQVQHAIQP